MATVDMKSKQQLYLSMPRKPPKVYLKTINPHITCNLCKGYLIDATTIVECLHSFCHSCIMMHLRFETYCPSCEMLINKVKPNIKPDATLQAIVYKLVPGLYEKELLRRRAFYKLRTKEALQATPEQRGDDTEHLIFGPNENISLMLEYSDYDNSCKSSDDENSNSASDSKPNDRIDDDFDSQLRNPKYLQCPAIFTISNLKKFVLYKFGIDTSKFCVEIMYKVKTIALPDYYTLMDVAYIYTWKRDAPMKFFYCVRAATKDNSDRSLGMNNLLQSAPELVDVKDEYGPNQYSPSTRDTEHDQSSDADSDIRSDTALSTAVNGTRTTTAPITTIASSKANERRESSASITNNAPSTTASIRKNSNANKLLPETNAPPVNDVQPTTTKTSLAERINQSKTAATTTVTSLTLAKTGMSTNTTTTTTATPTSSSTTTTPTSSKTTSESANTERSKNSSTERRPSDVASGSKGSNAQQTHKNVNGNDQTTTPVNNVLRSNQEIDKSKEKVKIKVSFKTDSNNRSLTTAHATLSHQSNKTSEKPTMIGSLDLKVNSSSPSASESTKSRFFVSKDEKPIDPESEYDFDQHLQKERKNEFLNSFNLTPRTADSVTRISKADPKRDLSSDLPKEKKSQSTSITTAVTTTTTATSKVSSTASSTTVSSSTTVTSSTATTNTTATTSTTTTVAGSTLKQSTSTSSPPALLPATTSSIASSSELKKVENKASKRKSREPVKNVVNKMKCPSLSERTLDTKWPLTKPSSISASTSSTMYNDRIMDVSSSETMKILERWSQQNKSELEANKLSRTAKSLKSSDRFSMPSEPSAKVSNKTLPTNESETSIIINNVQRPNQADTPRPSLAHIPNLVSPFFQPSPTLMKRNFSGETEIKELRNDDASKVKVYGPAMNKTHYSAKSLLASTNRDDFIMSSQARTNREDFVLPSQARTNREDFILPSQARTNFPYLSMNFNPSEPLRQFNNSAIGSFLLHDAAKKNKSKGNNATVDINKLTSSGALEMISNNSKQSLAPSQRISEPSADSVTHIKEQKVQTLLNSCNISFPSSLSITLTDDDNDSSLSRSLFNQKQNPVNNYIEIVKLPDETGSNEPNRSNMSSNSPKLVPQNTEKGPKNDLKLDSEQTGTKSPVAINLVNNKATPALNPIKGVSGSSNSQSSIVEDYQTKFLQSITLKPKPKKGIRTNRMLHSPSVGIPSQFGLHKNIRSPLKRTMKPNDDLHKIKEKRFQRPQFRRTAPSKSSEVPALMSLPSTSSSSMELRDYERTFSLTNTHHNNNKNSNSLLLPPDAIPQLNAIHAVLDRQDRQDSTISNLGKQLAKLLPLKTPTNVLWNNHKQAKEREAREKQKTNENIEQMEKKSSSFVE